jgi:hypothetical protein
MKRELIVPYNLQQNGVTKRNKRSIFEIVKAMVDDLDLSMLLWVEACDTIAYILNKCPHRVLKEKIP